MTDTSTWSTTAERFAPGNFVATWNAELGRDAHGVTRAVGNVVEANPLILVKWMHDLSEEWVRAEYLRLGDNRIGMIDMMRRCSYMKPFI